MSDWSLLPASRKAAKSAGATRYFTGKPCKRGHVAPRQTCSGSCSECAKQATREWREANPDLSRQSRVTSLKKWYQSHREEVAQASTEYRKANLEKMRAAAAASARARRATNPEKVRANARVFDAARRARKANADGRYTSADVEAIKVSQRGLCVYCSSDITANGHVDHKTPLSRGGSNWPSNLQVLCMPCNVRKYNRTHEEYLAILAANDNKPKRDLRAA